MSAAAPDAADSWTRKSVLSRCFFSPFFGRSKATVGCPLPLLCPAVYGASLTCGHLFPSFPKPGQLRPLSSSHWATGVVFHRRTTAGTSALPGPGRIFPGFPPREPYARFPHGKCSNAAVRSAFRFHPGKNSALHADFAGVLLQSWFSPHRNRDGIWVEFRPLRSRDPRYISSLAINVR